MMLIITKTFIQEWTTPTIQELSGYFVSARETNYDCEASTAQKKPTIHHLTTMLATSKNVLFPGHNHLLTTSTDDPPLASTRAIIKASGQKYRWLVGGCNLEIGHI